MASRAGVFLFCLFASCSDDTTYDKLTFNGASYTAGPSLAIMRGIAYSGRITVGERVAGIFLYSEDFYTNGRCGLLKPDDRDYSITNAFKNFAAESAGFALCFPTIETHKRFAGGCRHTLFDGSCLIAVAGTYTGRERLPVHRGLLRSMDVHVIRPEGFRLIERNTAQGVKDTLQGVIEVRDLYGGLKKIEGLAH